MFYKRKMVGRTPWEEINREKTEKCGYIDDMIDRKRDAKGVLDYLVGLMGCSHIIAIFEIGSVRS